MRREFKRHAKDLQHKAKRHEVSRVGADHFTVLSSSSGETYHVWERMTGLECHCDWVTKGYHGPMDPCSHVLAVMDLQAHEGNGRGPASLSYWSEYEDAKRQHRHIEAAGFGLYATARKVTRSAAAVALYGDGSEI